MSLDKSVSEAMTAVPDCIAGACIDMATGLVLSARTLDPMPQQMVDLMAASATDMFQGRTVTEIEDGVHALRGTARGEGHFFEEILVTSANLIHVFIRARQHPSHALAFVCRRQANVGMVLARARMQVDRVATFL